MSGDSRSSRPLSDVGRPGAAMGEQSCRTMGDVHVPAGAVFVERRKKRIG